MGASVLGLDAFTRAASAYRTAVALTALALEDDGGAAALLLDGLDGAAAAAAAVMTWDVTAASRLLRTSPSTAAAAVLFPPNKALPVGSALFNAEAMSPAVWKSMEAAVALLAPALLLLVLDAAEAADATA
jgi:hypothetical protein